MRKASLYISNIILLTFNLLACENNKSDSSLDNSPVVAYKDQNGVIVCNIVSVKDTVNMPLSTFCSDFEIIRLENSDDALIGDGPVWISENFIGIYSYSVNAYKLFDRKGNFLCNITKRGQGPHEFLYGILDSYIDETEKKVYLIDYKASKIMVFDIKGNPLESIPLPIVAHKGQMKINVKEQTLIMLTLPFDDTPYAIWKQDFNGNIIQSIPAGQFIISPADFSNDIDSKFNGDAIDYYVVRLIPQVDSLYHYDENTNTLIPRFTANYPNDVKDHGYAELPGYYILSQNLYRRDMTLPTRDILIDKKTLKGAYIRYQLDLLGNMDSDYFVWFDQGYGIANIHPSDFKEKLESALEKKNLSDEMRKKLTDLNNSITDDDNNIILVGKLK